MNKEKYLMCKSSDGQDIVIDALTGFSYYKSTFDKLIERSNTTEISELIKNGTFNSISKYLFSNHKINYIACDIASLRKFNNEPYCKKVKLEKITLKSICDIQFDKSIFNDENIRIINQFHSKFIACFLKKEHFIVMFDQHAVHERIRYEKLIQYSFDHNNQLKTMKMMPSIKIVYDFHVKKSKLFKHLQLMKTIFNIDIKPVNENEYFINEIPVCFKRLNHKQLIVKLVEKVMSIHEFDSNIIFNFILDQLASQACHGSIRFGDSLSLVDCKKLLCSLAQCNLPFECAHGRPSVVPLIYLTNKLS